MTLLSIKAKMLVAGVALMAAAMCFWQACRS